MVLRHQQLSNIALSIDIGGTSTKLALVDPKGFFLKQAQIPMRGISTETAYFNNLFRAIGTLLSNIKLDYQLQGIGIGAPSCNYLEGVIKNAANLPFTSDVKIVEIIKEQYGLPTFLMKDGNTAALGEGNFGSAKGMENYILLTLGTGLGCGIVVNGKVVNGTTGIAGEIGHTIVKKNGRSCPCGRKGCLETYVSATGLKRSLLKILADSNIKSPLRQLSVEELSAKAIFQAAKSGDLMALKTFQYTGKKLGKELANLTHLLEPQAIILAGGLAEAGHYLFEPTIHYFNKTLFPSFKGKVSILPSALKVNEAALLGAASLVWQNKKLVIA